jgi:citronellyl-CoA dehydrogenase
MATPVIAELGTDEQKREFLEPAVRGEKIAALAVTEPDAGSDVASLRTTARKDGDEYVINGSKTFITNATRADFLTLAVRTGGEGFGGVSFVLFPTDTPGFQVARKLDKLGNRSSDTAELAFDDCRIPTRYLLGMEDMGFVYIMQNFQGERLVAAIAATAGAQRVIDDTLVYTQERKTFGRPVVGFQVTRHALADMMTKVAAGRQLAYHCVDLMERGIECSKEIAMAKLYCTETAFEVTNRCLQLYGGYGYMEEYDIARSFRDTRLLTIGGGTSEIMKEIITKLSGM